MAISVLKSEKRDVIFKLQKFHLNMFPLRKNHPAHLRVSEGTSDPGRSPAHHLPVHQAGEAENATVLQNQMKALTSGVFYLCKYLPQNSSLISNKNTLLEPVGQWSVCPGQQ